MGRIAGAFLTVEGARGRLPLPLLKPMPITAIEKQARSHRANVFLDGRFVAAFSLEVISEAGLRVGDELLPELLDTLLQAELYQSSLRSAFRLLSYRPRSEAEMRARLTDKGVPPTVVEKTIERLIVLGFLDDTEFARYWVEVRNQSRPRGKRLLSQELRLKGISKEITRQAITPVSEEDAAYRAAQRQAIRLNNTEWKIFRRRLGDFLLRRGFDYDVLNKTISCLWEEVNSSSTKKQVD